MAWTNGPLELYHGTVRPYAQNITNPPGIQLARCKPNTDFGKGFYVTRIFDQAVRYANSKYSELTDDFGRLGGFDPEAAAVVTLSISLDDLGALETLAFVQPTPDWREFVRHCQLPGNHGHRGAGNPYDVVYGPLSASEDGFVPNVEQLSFHTPIAIKQLNVRSATYGSPTL
jgi:hypothetical protein